MYNCIRIFVLLLNVSLLMGANISVASVFGDNMVLQRDKPIQVWGWGPTGTSVRVELVDASAQTHVDVDGSWCIKLSARPAGGPYDMLIIADDTIRYTNILMGDVWVCSGQSNMGMTVGGNSRVLNYREEVANAHHPDIRLFTVMRDMAATPLENVQSKGWFECGPETVENFSATAYFFGRDLQQGLEGVPIGLIHTSWGGTKVEAWTSSKALLGAGLFKDKLESVSRSTRAQDEQIVREYKLEDLTWRASMDSLAGDLEGAILPLFTSEHSQWKHMELPSYWEATPGLEKLDGIVWFQRHIEIPEQWSGQELTLSLGTVDDFDRTYFNGNEVGTNNSRSRPSEYTIPAQLTSAGDNLLSVRVFDVNRRGGLWGRQQDLYITPVEGGDTLWLRGTWNYRLVLDWAEHDTYPPENPYLHNRPSVLYNAMLAPLTNLSIRGVTWYQGEANASRAHQYRTLFPLMIKDWRSAWKQGDFPFLYVQLPNWGKREKNPSEDRWAELRDAQRQALSLPNTQMAVIIDIGDERDIHPKNKQEVGRRLALLALADVYHQDILVQGPIFVSQKRRWGKLILDFSNIGSGLMTTDGRDVVGFSIAGKNGKFVWADAKIRGKQVIVSSPQVKHPVAVRYAWGANPDCNLTNSGGIPASPFKTDTWPDSSQ